MANDLATGLGLGLKAASMAGAWDEADKDRSLRDELARKQRELTVGENQKERTLRENLNDANIEVKRLQMLQDQANSDRNYKQADLHAKRKLEWEGKRLKYEHDMKLWQEKNAQRRADADLGFKESQASIAKRGMDLKEMELLSKYPNARQLNELQKGAEATDRIHRDKVKEIDRQIGDAHLMGDQKRVSELAYDRSLLIARHTADMDAYNQRRSKLIAEGDSQTQYKITPEVTVDALGNRRSTGGWAMEIITRDPDVAKTYTQQGAPSPDPFQGLPKPMLPGQTSQLGGAPPSTPGYGK